MEKIMTWYRLWLKLFLKKKSTWLLLLAMGAALYLLGNAASLTERGRWACAAAAGMRGR